MPLDFSEVQSLLPDRYSLVREVGLGAMATVYQATDLRHNRDVAIKVLNPDVSRTLGTDRFLREIQTVANLSHPHILPLHDSGQSGGLLFFVMPLVEGESLRDRLEREGKLPVEEAVHITAEIADALAYAHGKGVIHRDVKPANILLEGGHAVLADFGLAHAIVASEKEGPSLTAPGMAIGTPAFMSPEQASGDDFVDGRSDQYSLACVLFESLSGKPVFQGSSARQVISKQIHERPPSARVSRHNLPMDVDRALTKALQKSAADRFPSVNDFSKALQAGLSGARGSPVRRFVDRLVDRGYRTPIALAAVGVLAILAWEIGKGLLGPNPSWYDSWPESLVVLPLDVPRSTERERDLAAEVAHQVAHDLDWWDEVLALNAASLTGILQATDSEEGAIHSSRSALRVARAAGVEALLGITVLLRGDTAIVEGALFDAQNGERIDRRLATQGPQGDLGGLVGPITAGLLALDGDAPAMRARGTNSLQAFRSFLEGKEALLKMDVGPAREGFSKALELDASYASAEAWLGLATYWDFAEGGARLTQVQSDIARHSTLAMDGLSRISGTDSLHVEAFFHFQRGDYERARHEYERILEMDQNDIVAWLMVGEVEVRDPWMTPSASGGSRPRSNLNKALHAFQRTTALRPTFELGYSKVFRIAENVVSVTGGTGCSGYRPSNHELIPPGANVGVQDAEAFCPVFSDSVEWVSSRQMNTMDATSVVTGAQELFDRSIEMVKTWERFAPESPRPRQFLAEALINQREGFRLGSPQRSVALALEALEHAEAALGLEADTTPYELFWVANLRLAAGMPDAAVVAAEDALDRHSSLPDSVRGGLPHLAGNAYLATGRIGKALRVVRQQSSARWAMDPTSGELISYAGADPVVLAIRALAVCGATGQPILSEIARLDSLWTAADYTPHEIQVLRNRVTVRIGPALLQDSLALEAWGRVVDLDSQLWQPIGLLERDRGESVFLRAADAALDGPDKGGRTFMIAQEAQAAGHLPLSLQLFNRLDSIPLSVRSLDATWGFRAASLVHRAEILQELGRPFEARDALESFLSVWSLPDELGQRLVHRANSILNTLNEKEG